MPGFEVRVLLLAGLLLLAPCRPARADWTAAAFLGGAATLDSSLRIRQPATSTDLRLEPIDYRGENVTSPIYYGYRVGWDLPFARALAIEAEFIHLKVFADTSAVVFARGTDRGETVDRRQALADTVELFSISHGVNFVLANVVFRRPLVRGSGGDRLTLALRAGAGPTIPHTESVVAGVFQEQYELGATGWQVASGIEARLARSLLAVAEYKFTRTSQTVSVSGGEAQTQLSTHHVALGLGYRF